MKLDNWWHGKCKSCKYYHVEIEDNLYDEDGGIFSGKGYCHVEPPHVLMTPEGKPVTVRPETSAIGDCGDWQLSEAIQLERINHRKEQTDER